MSRLRRFLALGALGGLTALALGGGAVSGWSAFLAFFVVQASVYALLTLGLNVQWGYTGLFNVGVSSLFALGAYTSALVTQAPTPAAGTWSGLGWPFGLGLLSGALVAVAAALVLGIATLRLRGDYLAMATLGAGEIVRLALLNEAWLTRGPEGLRAIPQPWSGWLSGPAYTHLYAGLALAVLGGAYLALERLVRSPWGRALRAVRDDEEAARALGKHAFRFKLQALAVGAALMGLAGGLYAHFTTFISPADFEPLQTFLVWMMLIVGGPAHNRGAVLGAFLVWGLWVGTSVLGGLVPAAWAVKVGYARVIAIGLALQWMLLHRPGGLWSSSSHGRLQASGPPESPERFRGPA